MVKLDAAESDCRAAGAEIVVGFKRFHILAILCNRLSEQMLTVTTNQNFLNSFGGLNGQRFLLIKCSYCTHPQLPRNAAPTATKLTA